MNAGRATRPGAIPDPAGGRGKARVEAPMQQPSLGGDVGGRTRPGGGDRMPDLKRTPLHALHARLGARMVEFAGWDMPVQYGLGVMKEHRHTRAAAGLFDVGHMGQVILRGDGAARALEKLVPADIEGLAEGRQRYALFTDERGGILDDLMVANRGDHLFLVVNAARADHDIAHLRDGLPGISVEQVPSRALVALQGPEAEPALAALVKGVEAMRFMDSETFHFDGAELWVSRSGYTGEDGFEISLPSDRAEAFATALLSDERVEAVGLGARDSLRLEAGLPLYGHDIGADTTPAEARLGWSIGKARRTARPDFRGADAILGDAPARLRVGLSPEGRAPIREGADLFAEEDAASPVGRVTSGCFGPTVGVPVAMGLVDSRHASPGTRLFGEVRGRRLPAAVASLPFVPANFKR